MSTIHFENGDIMAAFVSKEVKIGIGTAMDPHIQIGMPDKPVERFIVGDHVKLFAGQIAPRNFVIGDYVTIHEGVWAYGRSDIVIGHNSWFGKRCTLDAEGGFSVGNGFGAGQDTHLWSHIRHGDILQGSKYLSFQKFSAADDVWFVGRCTSGPAHHEQFSVALTESNVTKGMKWNHVYGGNPAVDLTEKIGAPYEDLTLEEKEKRFAAKVAEFTYKDLPEFPAILETFNVRERTYRKTNSMLEIIFMRYLLPEAKFVPDNQVRIYG
jgi:acetyltransferase-like isoleucine patch superfamily enzyme